MTALNMAQQGLFGEVLHGAGGYIHNLEPYWDEYQGNWRLDFNQDHRGDVYATHGFGPICQAMNIHRGDRLQTLVGGLRHQVGQRPQARAGEDGPR